MSSEQTPTPVLEPAAQAFADAAAQPPPLYQLTPDEARRVLDDIQAAPVTTVRYDGIIHDFMMLNPLSHTNAARAAIAQAIAVLRDALGTAGEQAI